MGDTIADPPFFEIASCHGRRCRRAASRLPALELPLSSEPSLELAHADPLDGPLGVAGTDDIGDMAEQLPDNVNRLERGHVPADDDVIGRQSVAHLVEHAPRIFELLGETDPE